MAEICSFYMKVKGKPQAIREFIEVLNEENYNKRHVYRVAEIQIEDESTIDKGYVHLSSYCAWSIQSCMLESPSSYFTTDNRPNKKGTTIDREAKRLMLDIEVFGYTDAHDFEEHYIINNKGEITTNECRDTQEFCTDDFKNVEDFNQKTGLNLSKEDFEKESFIRIGGFDWSFSI